MNKPQRAHEYITHLLLQKRNQLQHKLCSRWNMIIKNSNNQNNVNRITPTTLRPKGRARIPACSQLKRSSPGHSRSWAIATSRSRETDSESRTLARGWKLNQWPGCKGSPSHIGLCSTRSHRQHVMETKQQTVMGNNLLWFQGGWGHGQSHRDGRGLCSDKVQLFARRSRLRHRPLPVTLWESTATGTGYRRTLRQILLEVKKQESFFFSPNFKIGL